MYTRFLNIWHDLRSSFWFVPSWMMIAAVVAAITLVQVDVNFSQGIADAFPSFRMSPPAARSILSSIVGAMVTSTGVVFSITIVALSLASSQFGSRLIRTYRNRKSTQFTLGIFVSTSLYCILVLASIREVNQISFVPTVSVIVGILLAIVCLATLIYYIHDMSRAIQAPSVIESSAEDLHAAIRRIFPKKLGDGPDGDSESGGPDIQALEKTEKQLTDPVFVAHGNRVGYIQAIDNESMVNLSADNDLLVRLLVRPGDFIHDHSPLAEVFQLETQEPVDDDRRDNLCEELRKCLIVGPDRTPTQDVLYAFNELVEVAVRALSPGINDPFTAVNCIDRIHAALAELRQREIPSRFRLDDNGDLRFIARPVSFTDCIEGSLKVIEYYAKQSPMVRQRIERALHAFSDLTAA